MAEHWDLLNIPAQFRCYRRAKLSGMAIAKARGVAIMIRHHGPRPDLNDPTRVNHYVQPNGEFVWARDESGNLIDVQP